MKSAPKSTQSQPRPTQPNSSGSRNSEMLTRSEIESLRREAIDNSAFYREAFAHLKPTNPA